MDEIINSTTTVSGTISYVEKTITYATSSPIYALYNNAAALLWLVVLVLAAAVFFSIVYFFYKRFNR